MSDVVLLSDCRSQGCRDWVRAGRPWSLAKPVHQFAVTVRGHGFTVYAYPDKRHLVAATPEDHTSFSATGYPNPAPRWYGNAADVMPKGSSPADLKELADLARQIIADKDAGLPGTEWLKYLNWTDEDGNCWQTSWRPNKVTKPSTDKGHIHASGRSDWVLKDSAPWDPVARMHSSREGDDDMGATIIGGELGPKTTNIGMGIVEGGAADPRPAWFAVCNDLINPSAKEYALRVFAGDGRGGYAELRLTGDDETKVRKGTDLGVTIIAAGWRAWAQVPPGTVTLSVTRWPVGTSLSEAYSGDLGYSVERGAVKA